VSRLLIVANDVVGVRMAGPGIRCFELGRALVAAGHQVTLVGVGASDLRSGTLVVMPQLSAVRLDELARSQDAILLEGISLVRYPSLKDVPVPLIVDLYDPFPIALLVQEAHRSMTEQEQQSAEILKVLRELLRVGDFFVCASEAQRDLWTGALLAEGRVNPKTWEQDSSLRSLIDVVPFGLPSEAPLPRPGTRDLAVGEITDGDVVMLWGGGLYNWFDPLTLIRAMARLADSDPRVKLIFMSTGHPNAEIPGKMWMTRRARELSDELGLTGRRVFFNSEWVAYHERSKWLAAADCGVSTHFDHAETRYAFRTRMLDYIWGRLPIICTAGDHFAELVASRDLGWVVPAEDVDALAEAIRQMAGDAPRRRQIAERVGREADGMTWRQVSEPLAHFLANPRRAPDHPRGLERANDPPNSLEIRSAEWLRLLRRGAQELTSQGPRAAAEKFRRWRRSSKG